MTRDNTQTRRDLREIFDVGVAAADPYACVTAHIDALRHRATLIIAVGKAALRMAEAALTAFPDTETLVVTNYENARELEGARVFAAGHPVPDENGLLAAQEIMKALHGATGPILALISGGGSALIPAPAGQLTLSDKAAVNTALLGAGLDIREMNTVRQHLSDLKGGGILRHAAPHPVEALILSDVIGDDLSTIASGPIAPPLGTRSEAITILRSAGLWSSLPERVRSHLDRPVASDEALPEARNHLVGSNRQSVTAMQDLCKAHAIPFSIEGDVGSAARQICDLSEKGLTIWGGETTVRLRGGGKGGRNQELALRIALEAEARGWTNWTCLQGGSDGRDGPTHAAGGLVDHGTLDRIRAAGGDVRELLKNNDSYRALSLAGDLLITGATGTNVADLGILIR